MLQEEKATAKELVHDVTAKAAPGLYGDWPEAVKAGEAVTIRVEAEVAASLSEAPVLHYRHVDQTEGLFHELPMVYTAGGFEAEIPASYVTDNWDLMVYVTARTDESSCRVYPGIYHPEYPYPYHVIQVV